MVAIGGCSPAKPGVAPAPSVSVPVEQTPALARPTPCVGAAFAADAPPQECFQSERPAAPMPDALAFSLLEDAVVKSGSEATFTLVITNVSGAPLPLWLTFGCAAFDAQGENADHRTFESECGGLCGSGDPLVVTLEPNGRVTKKVTLSASMVRIGGEDCRREELGPLPPGSYTLTVALPWTDPAPIPGNDQARASRMFRTPLLVTP